MNKKDKNTIINVGFIGTGRIADMHYPGYLRYPRAKLIALRIWIILYRIMVKRY